MHGQILLGNLCHIIKERVTLISCYPLVENGEMTSLPIYPHLFCSIFPVFNLLCYITSLIWTFPLFFFICVLVLSITFSIFLPLVNIFNLSYSCVTSSFDFLPIFLCFSILASCHAIAFSHFLFIHCLLYSSLNFLLTFS